MTNITSLKCILFQIMQTNCFFPQRKKESKIQEAVHQLTISLQKSLTFSLLSLLMQITFNQLHQHFFKSTLNDTLNSKFLYGCMQQILNAFLE